ncbi:extracellular solute-binding protein [Ruminococcaceae bacterium OttesenSCG-928-L11]|nr:extracellular solute-binding protein [Ruminococcaceae bacterium OttesenSCG-928-L11]
MKKTLSLILVLALATTALMGCGGGQTSSTASTTPSASSAPASSAASTAASEAAPTTETVKFSATFLQNEWHGDPNQMEVFQTLAERANVEVDWQVYASATWPDKKNLLLAGGDLPDVMYMNTLNRNDVAKYAPQGMIMDLTDLVAEHCPRLTQVFAEMPHYKNVCVNPDDGKMYIIARGAERDVQYTQALYYINKKWLDQLGLDVPKTTDEYYAALKAFKDGDMNGNGDASDEIPYSFVYNPDQPKLDFSCQDMFGAFGYVDYQGASLAHFIQDENRKVVYVAMQPEYKEAIRFYGKMVQEGLWDAESFTSPDTSILNAKGNNATQILGSFSAFDKGFVVPAEQADDYVIMGPLEGPEGHKNWLYHQASNGNVNGTQFIMTANAAGKEAGIMRWLDEHFDQQMSIELFLGPEGTTLEKTGSGMLDYIDTPAGMSYSEFRYGNAPVHVPCAIKGADWGKTIQVMDEDANKLAISQEYYRPYSTQSSIFQNPTQEESKYLLGKAKDIDQYTTKMQVKWLTEGGIDAEWDTYLAELEKLGIGEYIKLVEGMAARNDAQ